MAISLSGIGNVGEFYSHHYLDALLEKDLKDLLARWEEAEREGREPGPHRKLARLADEYFKAKGRALATASPEGRFEETHPLNVRLVEALGYRYEAGAFEDLEPGVIVPVIARAERDGSPYLWVVETLFAGEGFPPLEQKPLEAQRPEILVPMGQEAADLPYVTWEELLGRIFRRDDPPRWVILVAGSAIILAERHKWGQGKYLRFDLDEILGRRDPEALKATAALLARDALAPEEGAVLHDTLDESSHKHAYAVSEDLKYGIRRAVELLANEYIHYQRTTLKQSLFGEEELARDLTTECLRYLYRLLFLFYAEARGGELGIVPMKSEEYRSGYSLESLRDLEQAALTTEVAQDGYFFDVSLRKLFKLVNEGHAVTEQDILASSKMPSHFQTVLEGSSLSTLPAELEVELPRRRPTGATAARDASTQLEEEPPQAASGQEWLDHGFTLDGLKSPLFDPTSTPLLSSVKFRNIVLQQVIECLSLSRAGGKSGRGHRRDRGRISYAELGINQLGAVYEGLLSYGGFFAGETLYEVKPAGAVATDETQQSYFVPEGEAKKYQADEFVTEEDHDEGPSEGEGRRKRKRYEKGSFIFRLAGRNREKSASYYTPECLTQCVVKYSLKELLKDKTADEILKLTVCEPAMGSGAFLNEAVNQLADAYLERKQKETGRQVPPSTYAHERQKVKAYLATHNCHGVDLNPVAVELAQVSLWLNTLHEGSRCPWFELRMAVGNSLIGARRQVFDRKDILARGSKADPSWLGLAPESVPLGPERKERPKDSIYHFLLPADGMADFAGDDAVKKLAPDAVERLKEWRKEFLKSFDDADARKLVALSDEIDALWLRVIDERRDIARKTEQPIAVWGQPVPEKKPQDVQDMRAKAEGFERHYSAYRRLKLIMDYWCALWFWPIEEAANLPTRDVFLLDLELILKGTVSAKGPNGFLPGIVPETDVPEEHKEFLRRHNVVDVDQLCEKVVRLKVVKAVADRIRFHHWELRFAEVFADRGGFDLIVGNPPWVKVEWNEGGILSDMEPLLALRGVSASDIAGRREKLLDAPAKVAAYLEEFAEQAGAKSFLNSRQNYPLLEKVQTNLYKCFVCQAWVIGAQTGCVGFLHPEGPYEDPKGGRLRAEAYSRLVLHCQFINELMLFAEIGHPNKYGVNVYRTSAQDSPRFISMSNAYHPSTLIQSFDHDGEGTVPGIKNSRGNWELRAHARRLIKVSRRELDLFARVYDETGSPGLEARFPVVHSEEIVLVLEKFAAQSRRLGDLEGEYYATVMFDETYARTDGTIRRETRYPKNPSEWILSGPHFHVGTPLYQTPNEDCSSHGDYSRIDLTTIPDDYLPRTNYVAACSPAEYRRRIPEWNGKPVTDHVRLCFRNMLNPTSERTLIGAILPAQTGHINGVISFAFKTHVLLCDMAALCCSVVYDFFVKTVGKTNLLEIPTRLPVPKLGSLRGLLIERLMRLHCVNAPMTQALQGVLQSVGLASVPVAIKVDMHRRQALVDLDALAALALGLTEEELITIYRVQFQGSARGARHPRSPGRRRAAGCRGADGSPPRSPRRQDAHGARGARAAHAGRGRGGPHLAGRGNAPR